MVRATRLAARRGRGWGGWFWTLAASLVTLIVSVAAYDYLTSLLVRFPRARHGRARADRRCWHSSCCCRSGASCSRSAGSRASTGFRADAAAVHAGADRAAALDLSERLARFYSGRPDIAWGAARLAEDRGGMLDADAILHLTERSLFAPLDAEARREIEAASRTVAGATALIPLALADVLTALSMNVRMIRRIAEIYGAHSGFFGSWRLLRSVATHLIATGAVAVGDDMIHSVIGGSALARVSRRFGEGVINGALTARVGIAAMEVCRPLPFAVLPRPRVSNVIGRSLRGLFPQKAD